MIGWTAGEQSFAKRNALPNATAYHQDMPDGPRRIDWEWEEIVLACDLVAKNGWRQLGAGDPRVRELSGLLQRMSMHPLEARLPNFRNAAGVARKTNNIATMHPDYVGISRSLSATSTRASLRADTCFAGTG
jgi:hypothetical protein